MRVFSSFENRPATSENTKPGRKKNAGPKKNKKAYRPPRENLSAEEIKARVAQKTSKVNVAAEKKAKASSGKQVSSFMETDASTKVGFTDKATRAKAKAKAEAQMATADKAKADPAVDKSHTDAVEKKKLMLNSDVDTNDPNDPNVRKKLKGLLAGGFGWTDKEKAALSQILDKD